MSNSMSRAFPALERSGAMAVPPAGGLVRAIGACAALAATGLLTVGGCSSSGPARPKMTDAQLLERSAADTKQSHETFRTAVGNMLARTQRRVESESASQPTVVNFLAMSGGGDFGAFGAGVLVGWGTAQNASDRRPDFDVVTGVSTGALLAPFAYVGTDEVCQQVETLFRNPKKDWIHDRGFLGFLPYNPSFMTIPGLERDINAAISDSLIQKMSDESKKGKVLAISATDLDLGRQKFWDVGVEAEGATASGDPSKVRKIMLASAAIPAAFPPIAIDGSLYADGGVTANVFLRLDPTSPDAILPRWNKAHPDKPFPKMRYWIIVNNQLSQAPMTVQSKWPSVLGPSLATAIRSATVAEVRWLSAQADYVNAVYKTDIEVRMLAIPDDWRAPVKGDFKKETMESLADLGRKLGADPASWRLMASPRRDPPPSSKPEDSAGN